MKTQYDSIEDFIEDAVEKVIPISQDDTLSEEVKTLLEMVQESFPKGTKPTLIFGGEWDNAEQAEIPKEVVRTLLKPHFTEAQVIDTWELPSGKIAVVGWVI